MIGKSELLLLAFLLLLQGNGAIAAAQDNSADLARARHLLDQGKTEEGMALLKEISLREPKLKGLAREMGIAFYKKSQFALAVPYLQQALDEDANDKETIQLLGLSYYFTGKFTSAIPLLERSQSWYRVANVDALYVLGLCEIFVKDFDGARAVFAKMFDVPTDSGASYLFTARMLIRQDLGVAGEKYAQKAVALDPKLPLAHYLLGELYLSQSKIPEALAELQKELDVNPGYAGVYYKLADADMRLEKFEDAERLLQRSIWLDPSSTGPYILLGKVLEKKGESELAVRTLRRALTMDPNNPISHYVLGQAYHQMGRDDEANSEFKLAEQLRQGESAKP
jgi:tetratricopeptide (TPR) repeat protein